MLSQEYVHGPGIDNPWAYLEHDGASVLARYYHADLLGSIRLITDAAGDVIQAYDLGAARPGIRLWRFAPTGRRPRFGETTECIFPFPFQPFQYAAREDDPDSKLDYNRARYYNPRAGRFISPDPLGAAGGRTNRFLYVGNSPTRFKDPSGLALDPRLEGSRNICDFISRLATLYPLIQRTKKEDPLWVDIVADEYFDLPIFVRQFGYPSVAQNLIATSGLHSGWQLRLPGGYHLAQEEQGGPIYVHKDVWDPTEGIGNLLAHVFIEVPYLDLSANYLNRVTSPSLRDRYVQTLLIEWMVVSQTLGRPLLITSG